MEPTITYDYPADLPADLTTKLTADLGAELVLTRLSVRLLQEQHPPIAQRGGSVDWRIAALHARHQVCELRRVACLLHAAGCTTELEVSHTQQAA
ncbi:hypothetical protein ACVWYF_004173 [Hymenobacter sp. UYAg731]